MRRPYDLAVRCHVTGDRVGGAERVRTGGHRCSRTRPSSAVQGCWSSAPAVPQARRDSGTGERRLRELPRLVGRSPGERVDRARHRVPRQSPGRRHRLGRSIGRVGLRCRRRRLRGRDMFGYRVPAPDQAMLISGGRRGLGGAPFRVVTGHGKFVLPIFRKTRFLTLAMCESEVTETCVTRQGIALTVARRDRFQGRQRHGEHRQRRPAVPLRPGPDVGADGPDLRRPSAGHHRLDDGRGDRHRAAEARHRGPGDVEDRDGEDRSDRRLVADPVDRRRRHRLYRGDVRPAQGRHPAAGPDRPGQGHPGLGRGGAGGRA